MAAPKSKNFQEAFDRCGGFLAKLGTDIALMKNIDRAFEKNYDFVEKDIPVDELNKEQLQGYLQKHLVNMSMEIRLGISNLMALLYHVKTDNKIEIVKGNLENQNLSGK